MEIYNHHGHNGGLIFKSAKNEVVDENTLFFGLRIEAQGNSSAKDLIDPIADIFHLECNPEINGDGFTMVSQPMTLDYMKENIERIREVLDALHDKGIRSGYLTSCDCVINTPFSAYKGREALRRACGIVFGLRRVINRIGCNYKVFKDAKTYRIGGMPSTKELDETIISLGKDSWKSKPVIFDNPDKVMFCPAVHYRMFRGTLYADEIMAYVELVNNIVKMANSDKPVVTFEDLIHGDYISRDIEKRKQNGVEFPDDAVYFGAKERLEGIAEKLRAFVRSGHSIEDADDAISRLIDSLSESESDE